MKRSVAIFLVAFAALPNQASAATRIMCPLSQANRTITEQLPPEWWTTPVVDRLSGTRVHKIGGELALVCIYGSSGSIQRNAPSGACFEIRDGFSCQ